MTAVYPLPTALLVRLRGLRCSLRKGDYPLHSANRRHIMIDTENTARILPIALAEPAMSWLFYVQSVSNDLL